MPKRREGKKEGAIDSKKERNFLADISKLKKSVEKGYVKSYDKVLERLGRVKERHSRVAKNYVLNVAKPEADSTIEICVGKKIRR